jgi:hypothetical protein
MTTLPKPITTIGESWGKYLDPDHEVTVRGGVYFAAHTGDGGHDPERLRKFLVFLTQNMANKALTLAQLAENFKCIVVSEHDSGSDGDGGDHRCGCGFIIKNLYTVALSDGTGIRGVLGSECVKRCGIETRIKCSTPTCLVWPVRHTAKLVAFWDHITTGDEHKTALPRLCDGCMSAAATRAVARRVFHDRTFEFLSEFDDVYRARIDVPEFKRRACGSVAVTSVACAVSANRAFRLSAEIVLAVPFAEKDAAKARGARWDPAGRTWAHARGAWYLPNTLPWAKQEVFLLSGAPRWSAKIVVAP